MGTPIPDNVVKARLVFNLSSGGGVADVAVCGFHMRRQHNPGNSIDWQASVDEVATKIFEKWASNVTVKNYWSPQVDLAMVEAYHLDAADGLTLDKGVQVKDGSHSWTGTAGSGSLPWEVAMAVSLYTYVPGTFIRDGRTRRGRFYLPPMASSTMDGGASGDGLYSATVQTSINMTVGAFLNDIHGMTVGGGASPDTMTLGVLSPAKSQWHDVVTARVGRRPDSQRRRGKKLAESYLNTTIAP